MSAVNLAKLGEDAPPPCLANYPLLPETQAAT
jgi:hypothetical protein